MHLQEFAGLLHILSLLLATLGLEFEELLEYPFALAGEAVGLHGEIGEELGLVAERGGHGQGVVDLGICGVEAGDVCCHAEREDVVIEGRGAMELPRPVDQPLEQGLFVPGLGLEFIEGFLGVALVRGEIFAWHDDDVGSESVTERVEGGTPFAGFGAGPSGFLGVGAIDGGAAIVRGVGDRGREGRDSGCAVRVYCGIVGHKSWSFVRLNLYDRNSMWRGRGRGNGWGELAGSY